VTARRAVLHHLRRRPALGLALGAVVLVAGALPATAVLILERALAATLDGRTSEAALFASVFAGLIALVGATHVARTALAVRVAFAVAAELRTRLLARLLLDPAPPPPGAALAALTTEIDEVQFAVTGLVGLVRDPFTVVALLAAAAWLAPGLLALALVLVPLVVGVGWLGGRVATRVSRRHAADRASLVELLHEQIGAASTLRAYDALHDEAARAAARIGRDRRSRIAREIASVLPGAVSQAAVGLAVAALIALGAVEVGAGRLDGATLASFVVALGLLGRPVGRLTEVHALLRRAESGLSGVFAALDRPLPAASLALPDLTVAAGSCVALIGPTGAGKTTTLRALVGAVDLVEGEALLGGIEVREVAPGSLARSLATLPQHPVLLARTIRENVALGRPLEDATLVGALRRAQASFALDAPDGLDRLLGAGGAPLSGGEAQRLALARALAGSPGILLLDEPTAHVDSGTRDALVDALARLRGRVTILVATHDPAVAALADTTVALDGAPLG